MLNGAVNAKEELLADLAKLLVENNHVREYIKNIPDNDQSYDIAILNQLKILAQLIDSPQELQQASGITILEKAINYFRDLKVLAAVSEQRLKEFANRIPTIINVSGLGNNCGLFALVLGTKIALVNQPAERSLYAKLNFLQGIADNSLTSEISTTREIGMMLRSILAAALRKNNDYKEKRFENFVACCAAFLEHSNFSKLDASMQALVEPNKNELTAIYNIWVNEIVANSLDKERAEDNLGIIASHNVDAKIITCFKKIAGLLPQINLDNCTAKANEFMSEWYQDESDPLARLIKQRKLYRAVWQKVKAHHATEIQRQAFNEAVRKYFIREYFQQLTGNINTDENLNKLLIFSLLESVKFDENAEAEEVINFPAIMSTCQSIFAELQVTNLKDKFFQNYCNHIEKSNVMITADELYCLASDWNVQLAIKFKDGKEYKTYSERKPELIHVSLTNPSEIHWQVIVDGLIFNTYQLAINQPKPAATVSSKQTPANAKLRGVYDNTLAQPISNSEFDLQINKLANYLLDKYPTAKRVALFMPQSVNYMRCFFALHRAGMVPMPISPDIDAPSGRLAGFLKGGQINLIITVDRFKQHPFFYTKEAIALQKQTFYLDEEQATIDNYPDAQPAIVNQDEDLAYIVNTSGSSGTPKQVLVPHRGLKYCVEGHLQTLKISSQDNIAAYADPAFDAHIIEMLMQQKSGASLFIVPPEVRRDINKLARFYQNNHITVGVFVASMLRQCRRKDFPDLRVVICTGEKIDESIIKEWSGVMLVDGYGPAENTIATWLKIIHSIDKSEIVLIPNTEYFILKTDEEKKDLSLQRVKPGEEGELCLVGSGLAIGYTDAALTQERFIQIQHPDDNTRTIRIYKTRDVARQNGNDIEIVGRLDRQIKGYGRIICPEETETVIKEIEPAISNVYVDAQINEQGHPVLTAYLEHDNNSNQHASLDITKLYEKVVAQLGQLFAPSRWIILPELPKLSSGKVTIKGLPSPEQLNVKRVQGSSKALPQGDIEKELAKLFYDVLNIHEQEFVLYRDDNFFQLGGKSLQAIVLLQSLRSKYDLRISYDEFRLMPTVEQLAHAIVRIQNKTQTIEIAPLYIEQQEPANVPIILIHSLLGDALGDYEKLKAAWNYPRSIYSISARGLKNPEDMDNNLYTIAYDYYRAIKQAFPRGLKIIAGWSMGGILATLIKYFFQLEGDDSAAALMIDSESPLLFQAMSTQKYAEFLHDLFARKLAGQLSIKELPLSIEALAVLPKEQQVHILFNSMEKLINAPALEYKKGLLATIRGLLLGVLKFNLDRPITNVSMLAATETQINRESNNLGWPELVQFNSIETIDGNHDSIMLDPANVKRVAEKLQGFCQRQQNEFLVNRLANGTAWQEYLDNDIDKDELRYYIPARGCLSSNNNADNTFDLFTHIKEHYLQKSPKVLLLLGNAAVGKTTFLQYLASELQKSRKPRDPIALYIPLPNYSNPQHGLIEEHLRRLGFTDSQIAYLKKHQTFIFVLDGFDEIDKDRYQNLYATNRLDEWNAQVIIGCRNSYLYNAQNYREIFYPFKKNKIVPQGLSEITLVPFNDKQIESYIKTFLSNPPEDLEIEEEWKDPKIYIEHIDKLPGLRELIRTPFLLRVLMEVLPDIVREYEELPLEKRLPITQSKILDAFAENMWTRSALKLILQGKRLPNGRDIRIDYEKFSVDLAKEMELEGLTHIVYRPSYDPGNPSKWEKYFGSDEKLIKIREGCLLRRYTKSDNSRTNNARRSRYNLEEIVKGEVIGFLHPMLIKYFVTRGLYMEFLEIKRQTDDEQLIAQQPPTPADERYLLGEQLEANPTSLQQAYTHFATSNDNSNSGNHQQLHQQRYMQAFFQPASSENTVNTVNTTATQTQAETINDEEDLELKMALALSLQKNIKSFTQ